MSIKYCKILLYLTLPLSLSCIMSDPPSQKCTSCKGRKGVESFEIVHGKHKRTCRACLGKRATKKRQDPPKETGPSTLNAPSADDALEDDAYLSIVTLEDFLAAIAMDENARSLGAIIDADKSGKTGKELADLIAIEIQQCIGYKFM
jgi:hypothetical protein